MSKWIEFPHGLEALFLGASGEIAKLMDGFYDNIEDGLFEQVYDNDNRDEQQRIVELMREIRNQRPVLVRVFLERVSQSTEDWLLGRDAPEYLEESIQAEDIARRCSEHFGPLLQVLSERIADAIECTPDRENLSLSPEKIAYQFIMSCRDVGMDRRSVMGVQDLFHRFVLERLGTVYGNMNRQLMAAGFLTLRESSEVIFSTA